MSAGVAPRAPSPGQRGDGAGARARPGARAPAAAERAPLGAVWQARGDVGSLLRAAGAQAKLAVSQPGDASEREADRVADQVMRMPAPEVQPSATAPHVQRACAACAAAGTCPRCQDEADVRRKADGGAPAGPLPDGFAGALGGGQPLGKTDRAFFEPRFGRDLGGVRVHSDAAADSAARSVGALAFTLGPRIVFRADSYRPDSDRGRRLLAHELTHVMQQGAASTLRRTVDCGAPEACPPRDPGEQRAAARAPLQFGSLDGQDAIVFSFPIGSSDVSTLNRAPGWAPFWGGLVTQPHIWEVVGYSDCDGTTERNTELRWLRAMNVNNELPALARAHIRRFRAAPLNECVADNGTAQNRAYNRAVVFHLVETSYSFEGEPVSGMTCPPRSGRAATTLSEYTALVACAERTTGYTPRQMLAMLRQMYYGKPWSATSQTDLWDNVIPCSLALGNPEAILGPTLFAALHASAEVDGVDVGHVFTGLESMICPSPNVSMMGGVAVIGTPNEDFATWAGDLGASAASHVVCPMLGADAATNEDCFTLVGAHPLADYRNGQAPPQDMEGDIDAFVLRAASMGIPCTGSARRPLTITRPISELFLDYYNAPDSPLGTAHENRYRCFLEALGARLSGNRITNQAAIEPGLIRRVAEFAYAFYAKVWGGAFRGGVLHASDGADRRQMDIDSAELVRWFLHDLESRL